MPSISEEDIRKVREANDLVELFSERTQLRQRGKDFWCCCPFHQEKTPSCKVDPVTQTWHCFGCGEGGDIFSYVEKLDDVGFLDAVRFLARRANIELDEGQFARRSHSKKARLKEVCQESASFYHLLLMRSLDQGAADARTYLSQRNLGGTIPGKWNLGYAPGRQTLVTHLSSLGFTHQEMLEANVAIQRQNSTELRDRFFNRIMFPINDVRGDCIAFGGRVIGSGEPKYLNTGETPLFHKSQVLYGLDKAKVAMAATGEAVIVEGYTDVICLHESGVENAVATLGTSLTRQHIRLLSHHAKSRIVYVFDGDEAGQRACDRALEFIDSSITPEAGISKVDLYALTIPDKLDPADYIVQKGSDAFKELMKQAIPLLKYGINRRISRYDISSPEGKSRALVDALSILAPIKESLLAKEYAVYIASELHIPEQEVIARLDTLKAPKVYDAQPVQHSTHQPTVSLSPSLRNRLRTEKEFLSLCAQNPAIALNYFDVLGQTNWKDRVHVSLAQALLDVLSGNEVHTAAEVISKVQSQVQQAYKILTSSEIQGSASADNTLRFLAEELQIGDLEETIAEMKEQLKHIPSNYDEEKKNVYQSIVYLQNSVKEIRLRQRGQA